MRVQRTLFPTVQCSNNFIFILDISIACTRPLLILKAEARLSDPYLGNIKDIHIDFKGKNISWKKKNLYYILSFQSGKKGLLFTVPGAISFALELKIPLQ